MENKNIEYKSLRKAIGKQADLKSLSEICVAFANAQGGDLIIGIEDNQTEPPANQKIKQDDVNQVVKTLRSLMESVALTNPEIIQHHNGGEYFSIKILPSQSTIAVTSTGRVYIRISDSACPVGSEELSQLAAEKTAFQWELIVPQKIKLVDVDQNSVSSFIADIRNSEKVSGFIKQKDIEDILLHYQMITEKGYITNLGVLWVGTPQQRARLSYPLTIQYIVYDDKEEKIRKKEWHYHLHSPKELLLEIEKEAIELTYSTEIADGLFRKTIRQYPAEVIRELLINAIAHKKYTISGDIFIEVYPDRMTITNPGNLPMGITKENILHSRQRRNPHLIQTLSDLKLMEAEGSGYDLVYEMLMRDAKSLPEIETDYSKVSVTVYCNNANDEIISILDYVDNHFQLSQKEHIALGLIALQRRILSTQLANKLQLAQEEKLLNWIGHLLECKIIISSGKKKATEYLLNPELFSQAKLDLKPSLKTIDENKLEALIIEDLKYNGISGMSQIQKRLPEIPADRIQRIVYKMVANNCVIVDGAKKNRKYQIPKKNN